MSDGFTFNGTHSDDMGIEVVYEKGRDILPGLNNRLLTIPGRPGVYDLGGDLKERIIPVRVIVKGSSITDIRTKARAIAAWLNVSEAKILIFDDETDKRYMARPLDAVSAKQLEVFQDAQVNFLCPSPYAENVNETTGAATDTNGGTAETPCKITATMQADSAGGLTLALGDAKIVLETALLTGDVVVVDTRYRTLTINGTDFRKYLNHTETTWFKLPVGAFEIVPTPSGTTIEVEFRERWL